MLKKIIVIVLLLPTLLLAKIPTEDDVLDKITDPNGEFYYPNLMIRFEMGDIKLTAEQYHYLYYGYIYQDEYKPLAANPMMANFIELTSQIEPEKPRVETLNEIVAMADKVLLRDPFNPKVWNVLAYAYGALGDKIKEREAYDRVEKILATIESSGDGLKEKSPKHILMLDHAVDLMASKGYTTAKPEIISRDVEYLPLAVPVEVEGKKLRGQYFDFSRVYMYKPDSVTYTRSRTWQFNNLKPKVYK